MVFEQLAPDQAAFDILLSRVARKPGGGYVFATSNCIYTGMELRRYEQMLDIWRREGNYPGESLVVSR